jgi:hypothetical protein
MSPRHVPVLLLLLAACARDAKPAASPSPSATTPAPVVTTAPPTSPAVVAGGTRWFRSPSGNIHCAIEDTAAVCEIREYTYKPPPEPSTCEFDWGQTVAVTTKPRPEAAFQCVSDSVYSDKATALAYGATVTHNGFSCASRQDGIQCTHVASGRGFVLGRASYELF